MLESSAQNPVAGPTEAASVTDEQVQALLTAVADISEENFTAHNGGWRGEASTALIDAVFSIRATYRSDNSGKGVFNRVKAFRQQHPAALDDLRALSSIGEQKIREIMGEARTSSRYKSEAVIEAARNLVEAGVHEAADVTAETIPELKNAYTRVHGLGWVTFEYFCMLLGVPGVKADTLIVRFVNAALADAGLPAVDRTQARHLVIEAHRRVPHAETLTHFDHALWRAESDRSASSRSRRGQSSGQ